MRQARVWSVLALAGASICALLAPPAWGAPAWGAPGRGDSTAQAAPAARPPAAASPARPAAPDADATVAAGEASRAAAPGPAARASRARAPGRVRASRARALPPGAAATRRAGSAKGEAARRPPAPQASPVGVPAPEPTAAASPAAAPSGGLDDVIARIPSYTPGAATWVRRSYQGHLGAADWYTGTIYISPDVPPRRLYSVAVHEWSHLLQVRVYGGSVERTIRELNAAFGGSGMTGVERAADCMAVLQGAGWTHYTACSDGSWRAAAARLLSGRPA